MEEIYEADSKDNENRSSEHSNTAQENFLDDALDITEDDVESNSDKGSETDSGSYWSAIDEEEQDIFLDSQEICAPTLTADCITTEEIHTAVVKEYDSIVPVEAKTVTLGSDFQIDDDLSNETEDIVLDVNRSKGEELNTNEHAKIRISSLPAIEENSTFENFHSRIAGNLQEKTSSPEFRVKIKSMDNIDSESPDAKKQRIEKCIEAYDIVDQFDVKVSEREEYASGQLYNASPFQSFAAGLRRTLSFRRDKRRDISTDSKIEQEKTGHIRSGTWPLDRTSMHDFIDISYSTRKEKGGEVVEVLVVSPPQARKGKEKNGNCGDETDGSSQSYQVDGSVHQNMINVDIGDTDDLDNPVVLKSIKELHDDIDVISLSGFDSSDRKALGIDDENLPNEQNNEAMDDFSDTEEDVFDDQKPVRPPRKKKGGQKTFPDKRASSESDMDKGIKDLSKRDDKKRHTLQVIPKSGSKSDENIFKGILPFLEGDSKKKSLTGSGGKNVPPNKEELRLFTDAFPPQIPEFPQDRRSLIALEVYTTERTYVRGLELLTQLFKKKALQSGQLDNKEAEIIFSNVHQILDLNKGILDELYQRISRWSDEMLIGDIFIESASKFKMYATYCQNYDASEASVKQKMKKKKEFEAFLQSCYGNPSCQLGLTLPSYLITVVQRTPRYILLLKDLLRKTSATHPDFKNLREASEEMGKIASFINDQLKHSQSEKALAALQQQIIGLKAYYFSGRSLVHEGPVCLMNIKRTYQCVLFNDLLVFAVKGDSKQSEVELVLDLSVVWFQDLSDLDPQTTKQDAIGLYTPDRPYTIYVGTLGEKKIWLQHMKKAINKHVLGPETAEDVDLDQRSSNHTYTNGCVYSGEFLESKRHGQGTMMWPNQMTYRGQWFDDERNGTGVLEYGNGDVYEGEWKNDRQFGNGICTYSTGDKISCEWKIGIRHGKATVEFANGDLFEGNFKNDRIEGEGTLTCKNGSHYTGAWKRNMKNGSGVVKMQNGDVYRGEFKCDLFHGHGGIIYSNGAVYNGDFAEGQRHGLGTYSKANGIIYEGNWMLDDKEGPGKLTFSNGDIYEGIFMQNKRSGNGTIIYNEGGQYHGLWENDMRSGRGIMEYKDGSVYDGQWKSGQRYGKGKMTYSDGVVYDGDWQDDFYHGKGVLKKPCGWKYKGDFLNGKHRGNGTLTDSVNEYKFQGEWKNDKKEGKGIEMTRGTLYDGNFKNDKRDGRGTETSHDTTTYDGFWRLGQKHGKGVRKLINGMTQPQVWHMGCLTDCPVVLSREVPPLKRS